MTVNHPTSIVNSRAVKILESVVFNVKWILNLFYLGLIFVLFLYAYTYAKQLLALVALVPTLTTDDMKVLALDTVDVVMIANLVKMIITGSYNSFISRDHGYKNENNSSGMLKIKISTSIIVVASIHLLQAFVTHDVNWDMIHKQLQIYAAFLVSAVVLGALEYLHIKSEVLEHGIEDQH